MNTSKHDCTLPGDSPAPASGRSFRRQTNRGIALVVVLVMLALLLGVSVLFLGRASSESVAAATYDATVAATALAGQATQIVQAQIHHASTLEQNGTPVAWASQPGMVRTFASDGTLLHAFKLYSSSNMIVDETGFAASLEDDQSYLDTPGVFTDLNLPVHGDGRDVYPIVDPAAAGKVQGFNITGAPPAFTDNNPDAPMPVRWLYVLKNGEMITPAVSGTSVTIPGATKANPVVGRVAFWTDDESGKLNINTAGHGTFWDVPRAHTPDERDLYARFQPTLNEFQRYPGHPATTSLFPVFGPLLGGSFGTLDSHGTPSPSFLNFLYGDQTATGILPRVVGGGSREGTVTATDPITIPSDRLYSSVDELIFREDRTRQPNLTRALVEQAKFFLTASSRAPELNLFHLPRISIWPINTAPKVPSSIDKLMAFCSTVGGEPYYFQRSNSNSPDADFTANRDLYDYLRHFMGQPIPAFGSTTFDTKLGSDADQVATEIMDYIRGANIMNSAYGATPFATLKPGTFSNFEEADAALKDGSRYGQVSPIGNADLDTKGFGRLPTINRAVLHFYVDDLLKPTAGGDVSMMPPKPYPANNKSSPTVEEAATIDFQGLQDGDKLNLLTRACLYFDLFDPMLGYPFANYNFDIRVSFGSGWTVTGANGSQTMSFPATTTIPVRNSMKMSWDHTYANGAPGLVEKQFTTGTPFGGGRTILWLLGGFRSLDYTHSQVSNVTNLYPLISQPFRIHPEIPLAVNTSGATTTYQLPEPPVLGGGAGAPPFDQTFSFDGGQVTVEILVDGQVMQSFDFNFPAFTKPLPAYAPSVSPGLQYPSGLKQMVNDANFHNRISSYPVSAYGKLDHFLAQPGDIIVTLEPAYGDPRLIAAKRRLTTDADTSFAAGERAGGDFVPHEDYALNGAANNVRVRQAFDARVDTKNSQPAWRAGLVRFGTFVENVLYGPNARPDIPTRYAAGVSVFKANGTAGSFLPDFDTGAGFVQDGGYVNRADEGSSVDNFDPSAGSNGARTSWFYGLDMNSRPEATFYSPSKQLPSAAMFGSLPVGVKRGLPWTTLLFRPDPGGGHPGAADPPDHLLLDLFWMPVSQPYAISEPFSTSGKVNMNYQIMPFTYIERSTALHGVLMGERIRAVNESDIKDGALDKYKDANTAEGADVTTTYRIDIDETLKGFKARFDEGRLFVSESEVCTLPLIPDDGQTWSANFASVSPWWTQRRATGTNLRHRPYVGLLPRLTTRSNTFTVYVKAQTIRMPTGGAPEAWDEGRAVISAEYRGSTTIERFIDPNSAIPDYLDDPTATPVLDSFYRWRVVNSKRFSP